MKSNIEQGLVGYVPTEIVFQKLKAQWTLTMTADVSGFKSDSKTDPPWGDGATKEKTFLCFQQDQQLTELTDI